MVEPGEAASKPTTSLLSQPASRPRQAAPVTCLLGPLANASKRAIPAGLCRYDTFVLVPRWLVSGKCSDARQTPTKTPGLSVIAPAWKIGSFHGTKLPPFGIHVTHGRGLSGGMSPGEGGWGVAGDQGPGERAEGQSGRGEGQGELGVRGWRQSR